MLESNYPQVDQVMRRLELEIVDLLENGPRYVVASTQYKGRPALFKMMVPHASNPLAPEDEGLWFPGLINDVRKEAALLAFLSEHRGQIAGNVPLLLDSGEVPGSVWYVRELLTGSPMAGPQQTFIFPSRFYKQVTPGELVRYFSSLHELSPLVPSELAGRMQVRYPRTDMTLRMVEALDGHWSHPVVRRLAGRIGPWLQEAEPVLLESKPVITHNEPFATHFFLEEGKIGLIDWESSAWGHRLHDFSRLWVRFFDHDEYRARFERELAAAGYLTTADDLMAWDVTRLIQAVASLNYYHNNHVLPSESEQKLYSMLSTGISDIADHRS